MRNQQIRTGRGNLISSVVLTAKKAGLFTWMLAGLWTGDESFIAEVAEPRCRGNYMDGKEIFRSLETLRELGMARISRTGWWTLDHPTLGTVQWKVGSFMRWAYLRINGKLILSIHAQDDQVGFQPFSWVNKPANNPSADKVEERLGTN